jgi:hypothetical protein
MSTNQNSLLNNIISINPTGILDFDGTYKMNGANSIVRDPQNDSKNNLIKTQNNQIICSSVEKFENYRNYINNKNITIILLILIFFIFILIFVI